MFVGVGAFPPTNCRQRVNYVSTASLHILMRTGLHRFGNVSTAVRSPSNVRPPTRTLFVTAVILHAGVLAQIVLSFGNAELKRILFSMWIAPQLFGRQSCKLLTQQCQHHCSTLTQMQVARHSYRS